VLAGVVVKGLEVVNVIQPDKRLNERTETMAIVKITVFKLVFFICISSFFMPYNYNI
jgi:hypothetical protein